MSDKIHNSFVLASDHAGYDLKEQIKFYLENNNFKVKDLGPFNNDSVDYPDYGHKVAINVAQHKTDKGIVLCGSGIGISIAANKVKGVRAALCTTIEHAIMSRKHNDANILALGARFTSFEQIKLIVDSWLCTEFEGGRHLRRVNKIEIF